MPRMHDWKALEQNDKWQQEWASEVEAAIDVVRQRWNTALERAIRDFLWLHRTHRLNVYRVGSPEIGIASWYSGVIELRIERLDLRCRLPPGWVAPLP